MQLNANELAPARPHFGSRGVWLILCLAPLAGCSAAPHPSPSTRPAATAPAPTAPATPLQSFRVAQPKDLQITVSAHPNPSDHFPLVTVKVYNTAADEVIVGYEPGCVELHCGPYELHAPRPTFVQRREILRSQQALEFDLSDGAWLNAPASGDLMVPTHLPKGTYDLWASFRLAGGNAPAVESPHETYVAP